MKLFLHVLPLVFTPEVVEKDETAAHDVLAQPGGLLGGEIHEARFDDVDDWIVENAIVEDLECFGAWSDLQIRAGPFAQADDEVVVGFRVVGGPCAAAVAVTAPSVTTRWRIVDGADERELAERCVGWLIGGGWAATLAEVAEVIERALAGRGYKQSRQ